MQKDGELSSPVIIGGVGGSGTRVVAQIISQMGFYMGSDIDSANDNLWFLLLFKRPRWFRRARYDKNKIFTGLDLFSKTMRHQSGRGWSELQFLIIAVLEMSIFGHNYNGDGRGIWPFVRAWNMVARRPKVNINLRRWGWKEPNTHIYLDHLADYFCNFKYIHTIRHGLDMAFSENQQQLYNWGPFFGLRLPASKSDVPASSFKYWIKSNQRAMEIGKKLGDQKFLVVNFDRLCISPKSAIPRILSFLNIDLDAGTLATLCRIPHRPKSLGRYRAHNISQFDPADLTEMKNLGFSVTAEDL